MATHGSSDLLVMLLGGYDLRSNMNNVPAWSHDATIEDTTGFGATDQQQTYAGMRKAAFELKGFYDDAALASNAALLANLGATAPLCVGAAGNTVGKPFFGCAAIESSYQRSVKVGGVTYVDAKLMPTGEVDEGQIQQPLGAVTATGNSTGIDGGASSAFGAVGYLQVTALTLGTATSLTVKLQDSADNATWADIAGGGFTALSASITTVPVAQRLVIPGTIRRYTRAVWTYGGTPGGTTGTIFVGIYRGATQAVSAPAPLAGERAPEAREESPGDAAISAAGDAPAASSPGAPDRVSGRGDRSTRTSAKGTEE